MAAVIYQVNIEPKFYTLKEAAALIGTSQNTKTFKDKYVKRGDPPLRLTYIECEIRDGEPKIEERVSSLELAAWMIAHTIDTSKHR